MINVGGKNVNKHIEIIEKNAVSVLKYGAKGDGITDDTLAIQSAINDVNTMGGGTVFIPYTSAGYFLAGSITLKSNVQLTGAKTKIIINSSSSNRNVFLSTTSSGIDNIGIDGFNFTSTNDKTRVIGRAGQGSNVYAIQLSYATNVKLTNLNFVNMEYGIKLDASSNQHIEITNIKSIGTPQPVYISESDRVFGNKFYFDRTGFTDTLDHHFYINTGSSNIYFSDLHLIGGKGFAIQVTNSNTGVDPFNVTMNSIKLINVGAGIVVGNGSTGCMFSDILGNTSDTSCSWFNVYTNANATFDNFDLTGGGQLFSNIGTGTATCTAVLKNGKIGQTATNMFSITGILYLEVSNVEFLNARPLDNTRLLFINTGTFAGTVIFKNNTVFFGTFPTEPISVRHTGLTIIDGNTFINQDATLGATIVYNSSGGSNFSFTNNKYKGFTKAVFNNTYASFQNYEIDKKAISNINNVRTLYDTAAPTTGTWAVGDIVYNTTPASAGYIGWVCTAAGTPGTWKTFGLIS